MNRLKFMVMHNTKMASSWLLVSGFWSLAAGGWSLVTGFWLLVASTWFSARSSVAHMQLEA
jgi:hypothetical protein